MRQETQLGIGLNAISIEEMKSVEGPLKDCGFGIPYLVYRYLATKQFDVVHFNFGRTILPPWKGWGSAAAAGAPRLLAPLVDAYLRLFWLRDLPAFRAAGTAGLRLCPAGQARRTSVQGSPAR